MDNTKPDIFQFIKQEIHQHHLEQLQGLNLVAPLFEPNPSADYGGIVTWTKASMAQINAGISKREYKALISVLWLMIWLKGFSVASMALLSTSIMLL